MAQLGYCAIKSSMDACRELSRLLRHDLQLLVQQSRPEAPMATRSLYLQARPVEVYPVIYSLLPGCVSLPILDPQVYTQLQLGVHLKQRPCKGHNPVKFSLSAKLSQPLECQKGGYAI